MRKDDDDDDDDNDNVKNGADGDAGAGDCDGTRNDQTYAVVLRAGRPSSDVFIE